MQHVRKLGGQYVTIHTIGDFGGPSEQGGAIFTLGGSRGMVPWGIFEHLRSDLRL